MRRWGARLSRAPRGRVAFYSAAARTRILHAFWPHQSDSPFTDLLNRTPKYVASTTLREPLPWENSTLLDGDATDVIAALKEEPDGDLGVLGSGQLVRSLIERDLVDECVLQMHPVTSEPAGACSRAACSRTRLRLVSSEPTTTGVVIATDAAFDGSRHPPS
jgi:dihydrofolate reductase